MNNWDVYERGISYIEILLKNSNWDVCRAGKQYKFLQINKKDSIKNYKIKVKTVTNNSPIPFGKKDPNSVNIDYFIFCRNLETNPEIFIARKKTVVNVINKETDGSCWLEPKDYEKFDKELDLLKNLN